ncbi:MAG: hypothetical protein HXX11_18345 [Desulfuromonadales bacterium]|nr:hypothetical protein [Desulfuromonadales bacterium]
MQILLMVWNGINGHGVGTIFLKGLFIMALASIFWMLCELIKYMANVLAKLVVDSFRYLAIIIRGWPTTQGEDGNESGGVSRGERSERGEH